MNSAGPLDPEACRTLVQSERWRTKVSPDPDTGCVLWLSWSSHGYARVWLAGRQPRAHRVAWVAQHGQDVPPGLELDHRCGNPGCVNPEHLQPVPRRVNAQRAAVLRQPRDACSAGHPLSGPDAQLEPAALRRGRRVCAICARERGTVKWDLITAAARAVGLPVHRYGKQFGYSAERARKVLADLGVNP